MKRIIVGIVLLSALIACGRSDQTSSTGNGAPDLPPNVMRLTGTSIPVPPTPTAYVPAMSGNMVEIDTAIAGTRGQVAITMQDDQVLHLTSSVHDAPSFEWSIEFDPQTFGASVAGEPYRASQGFEPYPPDGWILTPLENGTYPLTINLRYDPCADCDTVSRYTIYTITIK
jgi:hypothetical protein